ncbi:hypothetical protein QRD43_20940 [Pelomonas sp. APW6]|uniref:Uncharacterized protein n=1 Tax=Roseateles subflavus TaxID=3053353 RepID=A0ABT7LNF3_9BURK|nr:hypothetical protein [Pelomonas sp. APW6]MDL5034382.1 hypothetical protein [Pelomonas sp. APW6]
MTAGVEPEFHPIAEGAWLNRALGWLAVAVVAIAVCWSPDSVVLDLMSTSARKVFEGPRALVVNAVAGCAAQRRSRGEDD